MLVPRRRWAADDPTVDEGRAGGRDDATHLARGARRDGVGVDEHAVEPGRRDLVGDGARRVRRAHREDQVAGAGDRGDVGSFGECARARPGLGTAAFRRPEDVVTVAGDELADRGAHLSRMQQADAHAGGAYAPLPCWRCGRQVVGGSRRVAVSALLAVTLVVSGLLVSSPVRRRRRRARPRRSTGSHAVRRWSAPPSRFPSTTATRRDRRSISRWRGCPRATRPAASDRWWSTPVVPAPPGSRT